MRWRRGWEEHPQGRGRPDEGHEKEVAVYWYRRVCIGFGV